MGDALEDEGVDSGYGDIERSSGGSMEGQTPDIEAEKPKETSKSEEQISDKDKNTDSIEESDKIDLSDRSKNIINTTSPRPYELPESDSGLPYIYSRSKPVTKGLEQPGVRVRPELSRGIEDAIHDAKQQYPDDDFNRVDYFEAAMTVALWNHNEVLGVMAELGYGMTE